MRAHTDPGAPNTRRCRSQRGFSLIELLVVVVVLGIVAGVATLVVSGIVATGRTMACDSDRRIIETAVEVWFTQSDAASIPGADDGARMDALVASRLLRQASTRHAIAADGGVTALAICA